MGDTTYSLGDSSRYRSVRPRTALLGPQTPLDNCPAELASQVNATGLLPVDWFRYGNGSTANEVRTCDDAVRLAMNMSLQHCGGALYFGSKCEFKSTVDVLSGIGFKGGGVHMDNFQTTPQQEIAGPRDGPAFRLSGVHQVYFDSLSILGVHSGVIITDSALARFTNCAIHATTQQPTGADAVELSAEGCDGCNVVFGSNNTALVIENSFWVWAEDSSFFFYPQYSGSSGGITPKANKGQRPSVIIRGNTAGRKFGIDTTYLLHFDRIIVSGGGFQYQQVVAGDQW